MNSLIRAGALQGFEALVQQLGANPRTLLRRHGLGAPALDDAEGLIPLDAVAHVLDEAAALTGCPDLGLRLGARQNAGMLGMLAVVIQNAPTTAQALDDASRYLFLHSPAYELVLDARSPLFEDCASLRFEIRLPDDVPQRQLVDGCLGLTYQLCRLIGRQDFRLRGVSLPHTPIAEKVVYRRYFGAPVAFAQPHAALHAPRDVFQAHLVGINPMLRQMAIEYIASHFPSRTQPLSDRVRKTLKRTLGASRGTKSEIGALIGVHPRTLQRGLDDEGTSFEAIREEVYKGATLRFLRETDLPLKQVAGALGFSEQSALTRSCNRWFGKPPAQIRAESSR